MGTKLITLILVCAPILAHAARPDRNAYLNTPFTSVSGLVAEIKHDPAVADRYMRHFGMSKDEVIALISKMHVTRLDRDTPVTMFSVPAGGAIKTHHTVMHKGERVFADADGNIILKMLCGNPVVGGREHTEVAFTPETANTATIMRSLGDVSFMPEATEAFATIMPPDTAPDIVQVPQKESTVINNITNNITNTTVSGGGGCKGLAGLLVAVPIAAFLGAEFNHHGCCSCPPTPAPTTPEPVSMTLLATGAIGLVIRRRRALS